MTSGIAMRRPDAWRLGADADAAAVVHMASKRAALPGLREPHTDAECRAWMREIFLHESVWLAVDGEAIVGLAARDGEWLTQLYLAPGYTGRGIGQRLLERMLEESPKLSLWTFQRNVRARRFYERNGFVATRFGDGSGNEEGEPDVCYRLARGNGSKRSTG
jgi:GNAT superfamily N-acetyltransferase